MYVRRMVPFVLTLSLAGSGVALGATDRCLTGASTAPDRLDIAALRQLITTFCPCETAPQHRAYVNCARDIIEIAVLDSTLRSRCKGTALSIEKHSTCGTSDRIVCLQNRASSSRPLSCKISAASHCNSSDTVVRRACPAATHCIDAGDSDGDYRLAIPDDLRCLTRSTIDVPSSAEPAHTPGSPGVVVTNPALVAQFGPTFSLNNARYTRFRSHRPGLAPDAVLILVPGFEGGAMNFKVFAENLIARMATLDVVLEVWAVDRRTNQLEDRAGILIADQLNDAQVALDWFYGDELGLTLSPALAPLNRRAHFYNPKDDVPFIAQWTNLVFSQDIDAVVAVADALVLNHNVFLGGHSAGTGFTARYAATDFNLTGIGAADPGYAKLRGLVLLEGAGGATGNPLSNDTLDRIEAKFDGALFSAVRDDAARCVDGTTACTIATEATDCVGQTPPVCTETTNAYAILGGLLNPRILASPEPGIIQSRTDPNGQTILQVDQGFPGNTPITAVPDLAPLAILPAATGPGALGTFIDDDGVIASSAATFVATSVGSPGPVVDGLRTWNDIQNPQPPTALSYNGPAPTALPGTRWGQEKEISDLTRVSAAFLAGATNFSDWYYPSAGQSVTTVDGRCSAVMAGTCLLVGNVGLPCSGPNQNAANAVCSQGVNLDSTPLSVGRGRRDIENLTQAAAISIPVIAFGGSNGGAPVPGRYTPFAQSIGTCTAPTCNGTPRIVDPLLPNPAFPTFGDVDGGFEVYISEGFAHLDVLMAEDNVDNNVLPPLAAFLARNIQ